MEAFDLQRMLIGDDPPLFLLEILFRTIIVYGYTLVLLRWLGSRTVGQLSTVEFLLVIALGSAVGDAMFYPDVPLLHALMVVTAVVLINKGLDMLIVRYKRAERLIDGVVREVIRNGIILKPFLGAPPIGVSELFQMLRERGIEHLGQVDRAYIEADGAITVFRVRGDPPPGLPIAPPWEIEKPMPASTGLLACKRCGNTSENAGQCTNCGASDWAAARHTTIFADPA